MSERNTHRHHSSKEIAMQFASALERGQLQDICQWLSKGNVDLNKSYRINQTPLLSAVAKGRLDIVILLLDKGADPNLPNMLGQTPLFIAVSDGRMDIVQALINKGADPSYETKQGNTSIYIAAVECHYRMLHLFLDVEEKALSPKHPFFTIIHCLDQEIRSLLHCSGDGNQAETKRHEKIEFLIEFRDIFKHKRITRDELIRLGCALEAKYETRIFQEQSRVHKLFVVIMRRISLGKKSELAEPISI